MDTFQKMLRLFAGLCAAVVANVAWAQTIVDLTDQTNLKGAFLIQQPEAQNVRVEVFFDVGESDNTGPEGLSHYVEHLVGWSADRANSDNLHARRMNAWANSFFTNYHNLGGRRRLPEMMGFAARVFQPIELKPSFMRSERNIVEREFDLNYTESPLNQLYLAVIQALYPGHARGRATIGSRESIRQITVEQALAFHMDNYSADRATLLISGNLQVIDVLRDLRQTFSALPVVPHAQRPHAMALPDAQSTPVFLETASTTKSSVLSVFHAQPMERGPTGQDLATYDVLEALLASALPGGLSKPLYFDDFWVETVESWIDFHPHLHPQLLVWAEPDVDVTASALAAQVDAALRKIADEGIPAESFETVRKDVIVTRQRLLQEITRQRQYAHLTARHLGAPLSFADSVQLLENVTLDQMNAALRRFVYSTQRVSGIAYPKE